MSVVYENQRTASLGAGPICVIPCLENRTAARFPAPVVLTKARFQEKRSPMRIALEIAPLAESCPPRLYGGTERIASYLTEELVNQGHEVTLFASGRLPNRAPNVPCAAMRLG